MDTPNHARESLPCFSPAWEPRSCFPGLGRIPGGRGKGLGQGSAEGRVPGEPPPGRRGRLEHLLSDFQVRDHPQLPSTPSTAHNRTGSKTEGGSASGGQRGDAGVAPVCPRTGSPGTLTAKPNTPGAFCQSAPWARRDPRNTPSARCLRYSKQLLLAFVSPGHDPKGSPVSFTSR